MDLSKGLTVIGLVLALVGAVWGAVKSTPPYSQVHVGTIESLQQKQKVMRNHLRWALALIAVGTLLQIIGTVVAG